MSLAGTPVAGASVAIYLDAGTTPVKQSNTSFQGEFDISLDVEPDKNRQVRVVAAKDGYLDATETVDLNVRTEVVDLVLRGEQEDDPDQLSLDTLVAGVAERLVAPVGGPVLSAERSATLRRAQALLASHDSNGTLRLLAPAVEREPRCIEFRTLQGLALLETGGWSSSTRQLSQAADLNTAVEAGNRRSEPNLVLGVMQCWRGNPEGATELFLQALETGPRNPLLLQEIGRAYLLHQEWSAADQSLARAIEAGAAPEAHLLRAQALLAEAKTSDADAECQTYLGGRQPKDLPKPIRLWWMRLRERMNLELESEAGASKSVVRQTPAELQRALPELKGIEPATSQDQLASILSKVGDNVEAFFRGFHDTTSREDILLELVRRDGKVRSSVSQNFRYLLVSWPDISRPALEEYRADPKGARFLSEDERQDFMLTKGFASASHFLLPAYQPEATFVYMGRQPMEGHETLVVGFAQRPEIARLSAGFTAGGIRARTLCQGVVWIDSSTYQIIRMRTDLLNPVPAVRLEQETTEIHYTEVRFKDVPLAFWLPREVVVTVDWKGQVRRNRHLYSDFHLFSVESKISAGPGPGEEP